MTSGARLLDLLSLSSDQQMRVRAALADPERRPQALHAIGLWCVETCLLFGCQPATAYKVAAEMVDGIARHWSNVDYHKALEEPT